MGVQERKTREKERRSTEIIEAAESVMFEKGIQNTTMDDIAIAAEFGKATLYGYYRNKDEILLAIQKRAADKLGLFLEQAIEEHVLGIDKLQKIGYTYFRFAQEFPNYYQFISLFEAIDTKIETEKSVQNLECINKIVVDTLAVGILDGSIRNDIVPEVTSKCLWGMCTGILQMIHLKKDHFLEFHQISVDTIFEEFFSIVRKGVESKNHGNA